MYRFQCVLIQCANKSTNKDEMRRRPAQMSKLLESESVLITITLFYKCFLKPSATELHLCLKTQISWSMSLQHLWCFHFRNATAMFASFLCQGKTRVRERVPSCCTEPVST